MQSDNTPYKFTSEDLPELYDAANSASLSAQKSHLNIIKGYLILLVIGSLLTVYAEIINNAASYAIIVFLGTLMLTILQAYKRYDKVWYNGRAVAESIKTRAWRYMMRAEPYESAGEADSIRAQFRNELKEILRENRDLGEHLSPTKGLSESVTQKMDDIRNLDLTNRLLVYRSERIDDQRRWYGSKAGANKRDGKLWFYTLIGVHALIIIFLIVKITQPKLLLPADTLIVIAGGIVTWTQVKKYHDLSTAYTLTAREIGILKGDSESVKSERQLSDFIKDAENAFSREHTQWFARKDN